MTLLMIDGFDDQLASKWNGSLAFSSSGRNGHAGYSNDNTNGFYKQVAAADENATFIVGVAFKPITAPSSSYAFGLGLLSDSAATTHVSVNVTSAGSVEVRRGATHGTYTYTGGTLLGTASVTLSAGVWVYVELKVLLSDTVGTVDLHLDGYSALSLTGQDTKNGGTKTVFDTLQVLQYSNAYGLVDDLYLANGAGSINNDFIGDCVVETLYPNGNGSSSQFTGSDGNSTDNYLLVDEAGAPSTSDYVEDATATDRDLYVMTDLAHASATIKGIQLNAYAAKSDAGAKSIKNVLKSGSTTTAYTAQTLSTTYAAKVNLVELNPDTSTAWTNATVAAIECGVEAV